MLHSEAPLAAEALLATDSWSWQGWGRGQTCVGCSRESSSPDFPPQWQWKCLQEASNSQPRRKYSLWGQLALPERKVMLAFCFEGPSLACIIWFPTLFLVVFVLHRESHYISPNDLEISIFRTYQFFALSQIPASPAASVDNDSQLCVSISHTGALQVCQVPCSCSFPHGNSLRASEKLFSGVSLQKKLIIRDAH